MKICMLLADEFLYPNGLVDARVYKEAKGLVEQGHQVFIVCWAKRDFSRPKTECFEKIKVVRVFSRVSSPKLTIVLRGLQYLLAIKKMIKITKEIKPNVIYSHNLDTLLAGALVKSTLKTSLIYDSHEDYPALIKNKNKNVIANAASILERFLINYVDFVVTASGSIAKKLKGYHKRVIVVYNSRPSEEITTIQPSFSKMMRKKLGFEKNDFIVGYFGAIDEGRGLDVLINSLTYVPKKFAANVKLLIGGGPESQVERLKETARNLRVDNRVIFTGWIPYKGILKYFSALHVGTEIYQPLPNNLVTISNKFFEYMGLGIPLIVSDFPEKKRIAVDECKLGIAVNPTNPKDVANAIMLLYAHPELREEMSKNARAAFKRKYSWEKQVKKLIAIYEEIGARRAEEPRGTSVYITT